MKVSQLLPKKGPIGFKVVGFGHGPIKGNPELLLQVNAIGIYQFNKSLGRWWDHNGEVLNEEEQKMLEEVWQGECKRVGMDP
jgi:hypothetical protein